MHQKLNKQTRCSLVNLYECYFAVGIDIKVNDNSDQKTLGESHLVEIMQNVLSFNKYIPHQRWFH